MLRFTSDARRPKFVFDTQVISYLSDGTIPRAEWNAVRKFMSRRAMTSSKLFSDN
jgi:hypothetical protein